MNATIDLAPTLVTGCAHDPYVALAGSALRRLEFFSDFGPGLRVLAVGCGDGTHLAEIARRGCQVVGVESNPDAVRRLQDQGLEVVSGTAECLPFADRSFDAVVCSVVVPYTDERRAIGEWARVLTPHGEVRASYHGLGYALSQVLRGPGIRIRLYGARTIANSWLYALTGRRLPGFWGDTLYQSAARLRRYYQAAPFSLRAEYIRPAYGGLRDVFFHRLQKES
jgi:SAM-dependent methyltransferase